jgi:hypothetical protein
MGKPLVVQGPDGKTYVFPEGMTMTAVKDVLRGKYPKAMEAPKGAAQYVAGVVQRDRVEEVRKENTIRRATEEGRKARTAAAERMGINSPLTMAAGANALSIAQSEAGRSVTDEGGYMLADEAAGLSAANAAGFWVPGMVNKEFGGRLDEARRQQPGAALAGDLAGGYGPGEVLMGGIVAAGKGIARAANQMGDAATARMSPAQTRELETMRWLEDGLSTAEGVDRGRIRDLIDKVRPRIQKMLAAETDKEAGLAKAMQIFAEEATPGERVALGLPEIPAIPTRAAPEPKPSKPYGDSFTDVYEEIDYVTQTGARSDKLKMSEFRELISRYPKDKLEKYARMKLGIPDDARMSPASIMDAMEQIYQGAFRSETRAMGFGAPAGSGQRASGFLDEMARGSDTFYDARLGPEGSDWNKAVEMAKNGYSNDEIAEAIGWTTGTTKVRLANARSLGIDVPKGFKPGGLAQTETGTRAEILAMKEKGLTPDQISKRTGKPIQNVRTMLALEKRRLADSGEPIPDWLVAGQRVRAAGQGSTQAAETAFSGVTGGFMGSVGGTQYDINGDGVIDETDQGIGSTSAALAFAFGPRALRGVAQLGKMVRGRPAISPQGFFHGSGGRIDGPLRPSKDGLYGPGVYLTPDKARAGGYAGPDGQIIEADIAGDLASYSDWKSAVSAASKGKSPSDRSQKAIYEDAIAALEAKGFVGVKSADTVTVWRPESLTPKERN